MIHPIFRILGIAAVSMLIYAVTGMGENRRATFSFGTSSTRSSMEPTRMRVTVQGKTPIAAASTNKTIIARINREPIYSDQVSAGIPEDLFGTVRESVFNARLERMIRNKAFDLYLRTQGVSIPQVEIDATLAEMRKTPPATGSCICCRYTSLEEYLSANFLTLDDMKTEIRNDLGVTRYVESLWQKEYGTDEKQRAFLAEQRPRLEKTYIKLAHLFFNAMPQTAYDGSPERMRRLAEKKMRVTWGKLKGGESFASLVNTSEDTLSKTKEGKLGCVPMNLFGREVEVKLRALAYNVVSEPIESPWGFHFFHREAINDQEWLPILKREYCEGRIETLQTTVLKAVRIERLDAQPTNTHRFFNM